MCVIILNLPLVEPFTSLGLRWSAQAVEFGVDAMVNFECFFYFIFFAVRGKHWNCKSDFLTYQVLFSCAYFFLIVVKNLVSL